MSTRLLPLEFGASRQRAGDQKRSCLSQLPPLTIGSAAASRCRDNLLARTWPRNPRLPGPEARIKARACLPAAPRGEPARPGGRFDTARASSSLRIKDPGAAQSSAREPRGYCAPTQTGSKGTVKGSLSHLRDLQGCALWFVYQTELSPEVESAINCSYRTSSLFSKAHNKLMGRLGLCSLEPLVRP